MPPVEKKIADERQRTTFAERLAGDCRRLASQERDVASAALFHKLACLFDEAAALQRWHAAWSCLDGGEFDIGIQDAVAGSIRRC